MGNRAVVKFESRDEKHGIYLHWNGGPESILAFLQVMQDRKWVRMDYASARFTAVAVEFFDYQGDCNGYSVGIVDNPTAWKDGCDNGIYLVSQDENKGWIVNHNGKVIDAYSLDQRDKKTMQEIVKILSQSRDKRRSSHE